MKAFTIYLLTFLLACATAQAEAPVTEAATAPKPLTFQAWKEKQILEAQNLVLRTSARISQLRAGRGTLEEKEPEALPKAKLKKASEADLITQAERDLKRAQESMDAASDLKLEHYINVYLPTLKGHPEAIEALAEQLSKEELSEIFRGLMHREVTNDTRRNAPLLGGLHVPSRSLAR